MRASVIDIFNIEFDSLSNNEIMKACVNLVLLVSFTTFSIITNEICYTQYSFQIEKGGREGKSVR